MKKHEKAGTITLFLIGKKVPPKVAIFYNSQSEKTNTKLPYSQSEQTKSLFSHAALMQKHH